MIKLVITIIIVVLVFFVFSVFGIGSNSDRNSAGYLPGDVLYSLDKSWEWLQLNLLTISEDKKIKLELKFLDERLAELQKLQEKKDLTEQKAQELMNDYNNLADKVGSDIKKAKEAKQSVDDFSAKIKELTNKQQSVIEQISNEAPEKTSDIINKISDWGQESYNKLKSILE